MVTVIDAVAGFLCQGDSLSKCQNFINDFNTIPEQMVYFVFIPIVFIILFVLFLSDAVLKNGEMKKYKTLLGVAIFIFIIFQGWYYYFLWIGRYWFVGIIIIGGLFVLTHQMGVRNGGGGGKGGAGQSAGRGGFGKGVTGLVKREADRAMRGTRKKEVQRLEEKIRRWEKLKKKYDEYLENPTKEGGRLDAEAEFALQKLETEIEKLIEMWETDPIIGNEIGKLGKRFYEWEGKEGGRHSKSMVKRRLRRKAA
jgi:hypothetical protein